MTAVYFKFPPVEPLCDELVLFSFATVHKMSGEDAKPAALRLPPSGGEVFYDNLPRWAWFSVYYTASCGKSLRFVAHNQTGTGGKNMRFRIRAHEKKERER